MKTTVAVIRAVSTLAVVLLLPACVVQQPVQPDDPFYAPVMNPSETPVQTSNGSLYRDNVAIGLFADRKATRIGDIITIVLQERTASRKSSNIEMLKDNEIQIAPGTVLGTQPSLGELGLGVDLTAEREFTGEADADQSNQLTGTISVTVADTLPNGTLVVRGEKWMTLNRGNEYIRISGLVRPDDVTPDNRVSSTKIANARITYSGTGEFADSQKMGWVSRFFNSPIWPF